MEKLELESFEEMSKDNYRRWFIPLIDHTLEQSQLKRGKIAANESEY